MVIRIRILETKEKLWLDRTDRCGVVPAFALLKVCSQINAEAALLPYSLDAFCFESAYVLELFPRDFPISATQAIRRLEFSWLVTDHYMLEQISSFLLRFEGLQELGLGYEYDTRPSCSSRTKARLWYYSLELKAGMPNLKIFTWDKGIYQAV
jgi:hypothetical protein